MNPRRVALHDDRTPGLIEDMKVVVAQSHANLPASVTAVQPPIQAPTQVAAEVPTPVVTGREVASWSIDLLELRSARSRLIVTALRVLSSINE